MTSLVCFQLTHNVKCTDILFLTIQMFEINEQLMYALVSAQLIQNSQYIKGVCCETFLKVDYLLDELYITKLLTDQ